MGSRTLLLCILAIGLPVSASASDRLINVDGPSVTPSGSWRLGLGANLHRSQENRTYMSFDGRFGMEAGFELGLRGSFAKVGRASTVANLQTGGSDWEATLRYAVPHTMGLTLQGGVAFPNTPQQNTPFFTYGVSYQVPMALTEYKIYVGSRGVLRSGSTAMGISAGISAPLGPGLELVGDFTVLVRGVNSRDGQTGNTVRRHIYGVGVRYAPISVPGTFDWSFYAGISNALGMTTGMSLSSALGNQPALTFGVVLRGKS